MGKTAKVKGINTEDTGLHRGCGGGCGTMNCGPMKLGRRTAGGGCPRISWTVVISGAYGNRSIRPGKVFIKSL
jgi:hypothetical protein